MALLDICDKISNSLHNRENCIGIFIDLSKAFDTIDHAILFDKLEYYGIRWNMITWFRNYLKNRFQYVTLNNSCSKLLKITIRVR